MEEVQKPSNFDYDTPSSEPFRIYLYCCHVCTHHHPQGLGLLNRSVPKLEVSLRIMSNSFYLSRLPACCKAPYLGGPGFLFRISFPSTIFAPWIRVRGFCTSKCIQTAQKPLSHTYTVQQDAEIYHYSNRG
jgi:hypothetical protein